MTDPLFAQDDAATPLSRAERDDLIPTYITTRADLNEAEQTNIFDAEQWAFKRHRDVLDVGFLKTLHRQMLGKVWKWAGKIRTTERNIGVAAYRIETDLAHLIDDVKYWIAHTSYDADEIAARFHHRLVLIHPFPNGNGRHARLATDLLLKASGRDRFTWGRVNLVNAGETRQQYITALRAADRQDLGPLRQFVRS